MDTNVEFDTSQLAPRRSPLGRIMDLLLGKVVTLVLAGLGLVLAISTFVMLSGGAPITLRPNVVFASVLASAAVLLLLGAVLAGRLTRVWVERRRGSAGSRLHVRLVLMFGVVAVTPSIVVAVFAAAFFNSASSPGSTTASAPRLIPVSHPRSPRSRSIATISRRTPSGSPSR